MNGEIFIDDRGLCESQDVGAGTRVWAFAHVMSGAVVGKDCNICEGAFVEGGVTVGDRVTVKNGVLLFDGVTIGDDVFLGPGVVFTNDLNPRSGHHKDQEHFVATKVEGGTTIGANSTVVCGVSLGALSFIGAGAVVIADVPAHAFMVGNPARQIGWACKCGHRLNGDLECPECGTSYRAERDSVVECEKPDSSSAQGSEARGGS